MGLPLTVTMVGSARTRRRPFSWNRSSISRTTFFRSTSHGDRPAGAAATGVAAALAPEPAGNSRPSSFIRDRESSQTFNLTRTCWAPGGDDEAEATDSFLAVQPGVHCPSLAANLRTSAARCASPAASRCRAAWSRCSTLAASGSEGRASGSGRGGQGAGTAAAQLGSALLRRQGASFSAAVCWTADASCPRAAAAQAIKTQTAAPAIGDWSLVIESSPFIIRHSPFDIRLSTFDIHPAPASRSNSLTARSSSSTKALGSTFWRMLQTERRYQRVPSRPPRKCCQTASPIRR